jgi:asparagine synthase (glutamine-hydrolysing)
MSRLAEDAGALAVHPLIDPRFVAALARAGGRTGFGDRTASMRALFADALPPVFLERKSKARFDGVFWRQPSRRFAESWHGEGVDAELVDSAALRQEWLEPDPDLRSAMLLQSAWLARNGSEAGE